MFDMHNSEFYKSLSEDIKEKIRNGGHTFDTETELREFVVGVTGKALTE